MKLKPEQLTRLADQLLRSYQAGKLMVPKAAEAEIRARIHEILARNFHDEEEIEEEARRMLSSHAGQVKELKEMDSYKMFLLVKQKIAQKRGFIL